MCVHTWTAKVGEAVKHVGVRLLEPVGGWVLPSVWWQQPSPWLRSMFCYHLLKFW